MRGPPLRRGPYAQDARTYAQALEAIEARGRYGIRLGLGRVRTLLRAMGDPELAVRGALVAGTNGKGSVIALAGSALRAAGYRVETPNPHLVTYRERIVVDGRPIAAADFARLVDEALPAADRIARRLGPPTEFELLTAVMFRHFAEVDLDVALVEVGLGGRLDATNAWDGGVRCSPTWAWTTPIASGRRSRTSPARRRRSSSVGTLPSRARTARRWRSCDGGVRGWASPSQWRPRPRSLAGRGTPSRWSCRGLGAVDVGLRGRHQASNAAVADGLLDALEQAGIATVPPEARRRATRPRAGRGAWSWSRRGYRAAASHARFSSTVPTTRTGPVPSHRRSTISARTSPAVARRLKHRWP